MAPRKPIHRIGPQKTSFADSLFSKDLGGYNWRFDAIGNIVRRPGQEKVGPVLNEAQEYGARGLAFDNALAFVGPMGRFGAFGLGVLKLSEDFTGSYLAQTTTYVPSLSGASSSRRAPEELQLFASQLYSVRENIGGNLSNNFDYRFITKVDGATGIKQTIVQPIDVIGSSVISPLTLLPESNAIGALSPYGSGTGPQFDGQARAPYFKCGTEWRKNLSGALVVNVPFYDFNNTSLTISAARRMPCLNPQSIQNPHLLFTSAQLGSKLYIGGMGGPLQCYDGLRTYAAGCPAVDITGASHSLTGTGITGVYDYKLLRRTYAPDGSYTDGPALSFRDDTPLGVVSPINQTVRITLPTTINNYVAHQGTSSLQVTNGSVTGPVAPMYKATSFAISGTSGATATFVDSRIDLRIGEIAVFNPTSSSAGVGVQIRVTGVNNNTATFASNVPVGATLLSAGDAWVLLRTLDGGTDVYYERAVLATGTVFFDDAMNDATMTNGQTPQYLETSYVRSPPPVQTAAVTVHQTRLVVSGSSLTSTQARLGLTDPRIDTLYWSEPNTEHFPPENSISFAGLGGIIGHASVNDILYVFTDAGVWAITGQLIDPATFTLQKLSAAHICGSPASVVVDDTDVWFMDTGCRIVRISGHSAQVVYNLADTVEGPAFPLGTQQLPWDATSCFNPGDECLYFFLPVGTVLYPEGFGSSTDNGITYTPDMLSRTAYRSDINVRESLCFVFDKRRGVFYRYKGVAANGGAVAFRDYVVVAYRDLAGLTYVRRLNNLCTYDDGVAIPMLLQSPFEDGDSPHLHKSFSRLTVYAPDASSEFTLGVRVEKDWDERRYIQDFTIPFRDSEGYGNQPYATDPYGDGGIPDRDRSLGNAKAKSMRVSFTHEDMAETPVINGWTIEYSDITREGRED
jgi:hypothetical protein